MIYPYEKGQDRKKKKISIALKNQGEKKSYTHSNRQNNGL